MSGVQSVAHPERLYSVSGELIFSRVHLLHSDELVELARKEGVVLPPVSSALSVGATEALVRFARLSYRGRFDSAEHDGSINVTDSHVVADESYGKADYFDDVLIEVLAIVAGDGCVANGEFILVGSDHGDVERWTVKDNVVSKERVVMSWANGDVFRYSRHSERW